MLDVKDRGPSYIMRHGDYSRDLCHRNLRRASGTRMSTRFWGKEAMRDIMLQMIYYNGTGDFACQHAKWKNVLTSISRVSLEKALHWKNDTGNRREQTTGMPKMKSVS